MSKFINKFIDYIKERGAEILTTTNQYEIARFKANGNIGIIYQKASGTLTFTGEAETAYNAFENKTPWSGCEKGVRKNLSVDKRTLLKRDGENCFYCHKQLGEDITVEHLLSVRQGGSNHIANLVLCHFQCNFDAGKLSIMEKIKIREINRS